MSSAFNYAPAAHNKDNIRLTNGRKPVRNDKACSAVHKLCKSILNEKLRAGVNGGGSLVKNQHRGIQKHNARNAEELLLPLGKAAARFVKYGVVTFRKTHYEPVRVTGLCGGDDFVFRCLRPAHCNVLPNGPRLKPCFLKNHAEFFAQLMAGHGTGFHSVNKNFT